MGILAVREDNGAVFGLAGGGSGRGLWGFCPPKSLFLKSDSPLDQILPAVAWRTHGSRNPTFDPSHSPIHGFRGDIAVTAPFQRGGERLLEQQEFEHRHMRMRRPKAGRGATDGRPELEKTEGLRVGVTGRALRGRDRGGGAAPPSPSAPPPMAIAPRSSIPVLSGKTTPDPLAHTNTLRYPERNATNKSGKPEEGHPLQNSFQKLKCLPTIFSAQ